MVDTTRPYSRDTRSLPFSYSLLLLLVSVLLHFIHFLIPPYLLSNVSITSVLIYIDACQGSSQLNSKQQRASPRLFLVTLFSPRPLSLEETSQVGFATKEDPGL